MCFLWLVVACCKDRAAKSGAFVGKVSGIRGDCGAESLERERLLQSVSQNAGWIVDIKSRLERFEQSLAVEYAMHGLSSSGVVSIHKLVR